MSTPHTSPQISVITPCLNRAQYIVTAIESVLVQNYPSFEHIIIDGGSTDGTLNILEKFSHLRIVSEPDMGMYDALNKGLNLAAGEIIGFLNTDDYYFPEVFSKMARCFSDMAVDAVAGLAMLCDQTRDTARIIGTYQPAEGKERLSHTVLEPPIFNAYFFSRNVFEKIGVFDTCYKIAGDRDFMLRFALGNFSTFIVDFPVYCYLQHPDSATIGYTEPKFRKMVDEHLLLSRSYIESHAKFPKGLIKSLVALRTRETIRVFAHCLRRKNFREARFYFIEGNRYNPFWLFRFLKHAILHPIRQRIGLPYRFP